MEGIKVGGENINNIRFADDTVIVAVRRKAASTYRHS